MTLDVPGNTVRLRDEIVDRELAKIGVTDPTFRPKAFAQSLLFMAEIIPLIHRLYAPLGINVTKTAVDIGPQTGIGSQLLAEIHAPQSWNKLKLEVSAIDITPVWQDVMRIVAPDVSFSVGDVYTETRTWDLVIASHVIEHVPNPERFVKRLQEMAVDYVIIATPWNESPITTKGHINTINKALTRAVGARDLHIYTNYCWGKDREVCMFWVPGKAAEAQGQPPVVS